MRAMFSKKGATSCGKAAAAANGGRGSAGAGAAFRGGRGSDEQRELAGARARPPRPPHRAALLRVDVPRAHARAAGHARAPERFRRDVAGQPAPPPELVARGIVAEAAAVRREDAVLQLGGVARCGGGLRRRDEEGLAVRGRLN